MANPSRFGVVTVALVAVVSALAALEGCAPTQDARVATPNLFLRNTSFAGEAVTTAPAETTVRVREERRVLVREPTPKAVAQRGSDGHQRAPAPPRGSK